MDEININASLLFYCGPMGSGKTTNLISSWFAHRNAGFLTIVGKPVIDTKGNDRVIARNGQFIDTDFLVGENDSVFDVVKNKFPDVDVIMIDEAQFLKAHHIDDLARLVYEEDKIVICYGLLTDFMGNLFEGSRRLIEVGAEMTRLTIPCKCRRASRIHNLRKVNGVPVFDGEQVVIDGSSGVVEYESMCGKCYFKNRRRVLTRKLDSEQCVIPGFE